MLAAHPIDVMLLATDLNTAKDFYGHKDGLEIVLESDQFITFGCGGDSRLVVTKSSAGSADRATKASWRVTDLAAEVADLRARGVDIDDLPELSRSTASPTSDSPTRPGSPTRIETPSACSSSRQTPAGEAATAGAGALFVAATEVVDPISKVEEYLCAIAFLAEPASRSSRTASGP